MMFQSTRPRGARRGLGLVQLFAKRFNPRARVGRDAARPGRTLCPRGFNPRARVGRDPHCGGTDLQIDWFQSTRPRGARPAA